MPSVVRTAKMKEKKEAMEAVQEQTQGEHESNNSSTDTSSASSKEPLQKLVYDYLLSENLDLLANNFLTHVTGTENPDQFKSSASVEGGLEAVYKAYLARRRAEAHGAMLCSSSEEGEGERERRGEHELLAHLHPSDHALLTESQPQSAALLGAKRKRKRTPAAQKRETTGPGGGDMMMKEESQKQYTFGWKRYAEYCSVHSLDTLIGAHAAPDSQILEFARYLMQNPAKSVKSAVANSYVSAVGKRLLEAGVS